MLVVSLTVGGGLLTRELYREPGATSDGAIALPTTSSLTQEEQPGSPAVELTPDAAAHPQDETVRQLLQRYFDSINGRDYNGWKTTVSRQRIQGKTQNEWLKEYRSTRDGSILVYRIEAARGDGMEVLVAFSSTQDPSDAPVGLPERCVRWRLTLPLVRDGGQWKIDALPLGTAAEHAKC